MILLMTAVYLARSRWRGPARTNGESAPLLTTPSSSEPHRLTDLVDVDTVDLSVDEYEDRAEGTADERDHKPPTILHTIYQWIV